jgi:hypothetical protein
MSPPGNLSLSAQQRDTTRPTLVRNGLAHADTPAKGIGHYITLAAEADVALSTLSPVRRAITRAHAESRRTHAPLPRLVLHGGINRDIIEWMGGLPGDRFRRFSPLPGLVTVNRIQGIGAGTCRLACAAPMSAGEASSC